MGVVGGALLAVPSLLTMQFLMTSTRPSFGYGAAIMGSLPPSSFATALFADVFGSLRWTYDYWGPDWQSMDGNTWTDRAVNYLFAGTLPAVLILWHGIAGGASPPGRSAIRSSCSAPPSCTRSGATPRSSRRLRPFPRRRPLPPARRRDLRHQYRACPHVGYLVHRYVMEGAPRLWGAGGLARAARLALPGAPSPSWRASCGSPTATRPGSTTCRTPCATG